eukprot:scaffold2549_cov108-Isochrysis_galbana.AAC.12
MAGSSTAGATDYLTPDGEAWRFSRLDLRASHRAPASPACGAQASTESMAQIWGCSARARTA